MTRSGDVNGDRAKTANLRPSLERSALRRRAPAIRIERRVAHFRSLLIWPVLVGGTALAGTALVAIFGTTISPYLFFWQASQEVEYLHEEPRRKPLVKDRNGGVAAIGRIRLDTMVGMAISNLIALAILISMAAVAAKSGASTIETSAQAAEALRPVAGPYAFALFAAGVIGTGLLAVPVLAGSAAYAVGEARQWPVGLGRRPLEARAFYGTIAVATALGTLLNLAPINPIQALFWSAVLNGVVAVPVMAAMMLMARRSDVMGRWVIGRPLQLLGWTATLIMTLCVSGMLLLSLLPRLTGAS
jgi:Mn2+/Fe2+ NRAMP family transporter